MLVRYVPVFMIRPSFILLRLVYSGGARVAAQTAGVPGRERLGPKPCGRGTGVGGAGQILLNPLEPLLRFVHLAQPGISVRDADHELAAFVRAEVAEIGSLDRVRFLVITQSLFN